MSAGGETEKKEMVGHFQNKLKNTMTVTLTSNTGLTQLKSLGEEGKKDSNGKK